MSEPLQWVIAYCVAATIISHVYLALRIKARRAHYKRSQAARKAAATRRANGTVKKAKEEGIGTGRSVWAGPEPKQPKKDERTVAAESAWFQVLNGSTDEDEPDYNELDLENWKPVVRRFDGTAKEYSQREDNR